MMNYFHLESNLQWQQSTRYPWRNVASYVIIYTSTIRHLIKRISLRLNWFSWTISINFDGCMRLYTPIYKSGNYFPSVRNLSERYYHEISMELKFGRDNHSFHDKVREFPCLRGYECKVHIWKILSLVKDHCHFI